MIKVLFAGGGTGGHVYPAIALARELIKRHPTADTLFVGAKRGLENQIVPSEGFRLTTLEITSFPRRLSIEQLRTASRAFWALVEARRILCEYRPDVVVGTGGYAAGPMLLVAALYDYPTLIHEQNAFPSLTNRLLARFVDKIAVSHSAALPFFPKQKVTVTGNPLRPEVLSADGKSARYKLGISQEEKVLVVVGGSGGAMVLNETLSKCYGEFARRQVRVFHVTGKRDFEFLKRIAAPYLGPQLELIDYATDLPSLLAAADLVVSRPGSTTAELAYLGKPSILIPFPSAAENHQHHNARVFSEAGAAILLEQQDLTPERLVALASEVLFDHKKLSSMSEQATELALPRAGEDLCDLLEGLLLTLSK
ncbi:MAG: UDP-N-acetylglucosamine--N-acetylmuramyl-(pentapeptide) pyrophosphoryl-undecaprenol N-acetylglucosamine transferase [Firmicutes bacterium]|nr:UDP-N-acetylglucosamine--N-acetylmuramyl-(pentapeptide) pyrophosphoryl-undecaprenol N-acetylglucosamine transferase [Bacillota bacterium]